MAFYRVIIKICTDSGGRPHAECDAFLYRKVRCMDEVDARDIALRKVEGDSSLPFFAAFARYGGAFHFSIARIIKLSLWEWLFWNQTGVILVHRENSVVSRLVMTQTKLKVRKQIGRLKGRLADLILADVKVSTKA